MWNLWGLFKTFLNLGPQPFANKYPKDAQEVAAETRTEMVIEFCNECNSAQIETVIDRSLMFNDYYYLSSVNKELVTHFEELAQEELHGCTFVLDVGSNDGIFLPSLKGYGCQVCWY